jgi:hypothetical protein
MARTHEFWALVEPLLPATRTELTKATTATIRAKLLKIGAVIRNTRRVRLLFASHLPLRHVFLAAARALVSP